MKASMEINNNNTCGKGTKHLFFVVVAAALALANINVIKIDFLAEAAFRSRSLNSAVVVVSSAAFLL